MHNKTKQPLSNGNLANNQLHIIRGKVKMCRNVSPSGMASNPIFLQTQ